MPRLLRFSALLLIVTAILWGCSPLATSFTPTFSTTNRVVIQTPATPILVTATEIIDYSPTLPEASRAGACLLNSSTLPRIDAWQCIIDTQIYDPCLTVGAEATVVCVSNPLSPTSAFRVDLIGPLPQVQSASGRQPLPAENLNELWYFGIDLVDGVTVLQNGEFTYVPSSQTETTDTQAKIDNVTRKRERVSVRLSELQTFGDLDADGDDDAAVILIANAGGDFTRYYLAVVRNDAAIGVNVATIALGDGIQVDTVAIEGGQVVVDLITHGPQDPLCCPTRNESRFYNLANNQLTPYINGWQVELSDGVVCTRSPALIDPDYQCTDGQTLVGNLQPGMVWTAQRQALNVSASNLETVQIRRVWQ